MTSKESIMRGPKKVLFAVIVLGALAMPTLAADAAPKASPQVPAGSVIEKVVFDGVLSFEQGIVLDRIGIKPGDVLTSGAIERLSRQLLTLRVPRSFSYQEGTKPGHIVLSIGAGC